MNLDGLRPWGGLAGGSPESADVVVAGIPYDGSAVYRKGAALAPQRIRSLSAAMPPVTEDGRLLTGLQVADLGDLDAGPDIETGWSKVADQLARVPPNALLTVLGGDHCTAISTLSAQVRRHPDVAVLWVDAHPDLCEYSRGGRWTCGCALRRAIDASGLDPQRVIIAGGRDYDPEELEFIAANGMLLVSTQELARDLTRSAEKIAARLAGQKVHVSFDIDVLDPAFAPGTEIPSAGGVSTRQALDLVRMATESATLVGFDIVEVSPPFDSGDITTFAALKMIFEVWGMSWNAGRHVQPASSEGAPASSRRAAARVLGARGDQGHGKR
jgi:agmatinase